MKTFFIAIYVSHLLDKRSDGLAFYNAKSMSWGDLSDATPYLTQSQAEEATVNTRLTCIRFIAEIEITTRHSGIGDYAVAVIEKEVKDCNIVVYLKGFISYASYTTNDSYDFKITDFDRRSRFNMILKASLVADKFTELNAEKTRLVFPTNLRLSAIVVKVDHDRLCSNVRALYNVIEEKTQDAPADVLDETPTVAMASHSEMQRASVGKKEHFVIYGRLNHASCTGTTALEIKLYIRSLEWSTKLTKLETYKYKRHDVTIDRAAAIVFNSEDRAAEAIRVLQEKLGTVFEMESL